MLSYYRQTRCICISILYAVLAYEECTRHKKTMLSSMVSSNLSIQAIQASSLIFLILVCFILTMLHSNLNEEDPSLTPASVQPEWSVYQYRCPGTSVRLCWSSCSMTLSVNFLHGFLVFAILNLYSFTFWMRMSSYWRHSVLSQNYSITPLFCFLNNLMDQRKATSKRCVKGHSLLTSSVSPRASAARDLRQKGLIISAVLLLFWSA